MNVGLVIHSQTGHTDYVAHKIEDLLKTKGIKPSYMNVVAKRDSGKDGIKFKKEYDLAPYDVLVFGSHVEGFKLAKEMQEYLGHVGSLEGKKAFCIVTQGTKFKFMGATKSLEQMEEALLKKGAGVIAKESLSWSGVDKREENAVAISQKIAGMI